MAPSDLGGQPRSARPCRESPPVRRSISASAHYFRALPPPCHRPSPSPGGVVQQIDVGHPSITSAILGIDADRGKIPESNAKATVDRCKKKKSQGTRSVSRSIHCLSPSIASAGSWRCPSPSPFATQTTAQRPGDPTPPSPPARSAGARWPIPAPRADVFASAPLRGMADGGPP